ncbi:unnamed protein product [Urochloa humidicola]
MSAGAGFPSWMMLELFVFRRDEEESFPDETEAPIRASGTTSWGAPFRIAFSVAELPRISRIYAQLPEPGFPPRNVLNPHIAIMATPHRDLALLFASTNTPSLVQSFSILRANQNNPCSSSLQTLPPCTAPKFYYYHGGDIRRCPSYNGTPRLLVLRSLGLWCGDKEEFVVAELTTYGHANKAFAEICMLRGHCTTSSSSANHRQVGGRWKSVHVEILSADDNDLGLCGFGIDAAIGFQRWLCWIDYRQGILFCDMSNELPNPSVSFLRFPLDWSTTKCNIWYGGVSVVGHGRALKFVNVARHDGVAYGALIPGTGFTITCHTLVLLGNGSMAWKEDYTVTSDELWDANPPDRLPRGILMFPRVDVDRPHVLHFVFIDFTSKKMWVVSIDMSTKTVESFSLYFNGRECLETDDHDFFVKILRLHALELEKCCTPGFEEWSRISARHAEFAGAAPDARTGDPPCAAAEGEDVISRRCGR